MFGGYLQPDNPISLITGLINQSGGTLSGSLGPGIVYSGNIAAAQIGTPHIASGGFTSGAIGSGTLINALVASGGFQSGVIGSGTIGTYEHASGAILASCVDLIPVNSGALENSPAVITAEPVSGVRAVQIDTSGHIRIAMAAVSGRMPACGIVTDNVASGIRTNLRVAGFVQFPTAGSGQTADFSGQVGSRLWVGLSGQLLTASGAAWAGGGSGGWLSGAFTQALGVVANSGGAVYNVTPHSWSGNLSSGLGLFLAGVGTF